MVFGESSQFWLLAYVFFNVGGLSLFSAFVSK